MTQLTISLSDQHAEFVADQARKEGFDTVSEYLAALIRSIQQREARRALDAKLREGLESGPGTPMTRADWESIEREAMTRLNHEHVEP